MAPAEAAIAAGRRVVLFDLDGTLLDSKLSIRDTLNTVLAERGLPPFSAGDLDRLIGKPLRHILAERSNDEAAVEAMTHRYRSAYNETGWVTVRLFPGLLDLLHDLRRRGVPLGIVTSKGQHETETLLFDLGIANLFDAVVGDDDRRPLKPDPAPVHAACQQLNVKPGQAVLVGDTRFDVVAANAAGATSIGVLWGIHSRDILRDAGAHALAANVPALGRLLDAWLTAKAPTSAS